MKINTSLLKNFCGSFTLTAATTRLALSLLWLGISLVTAQAATTLNWDPLGSGAASDGSGTWDDSTNWWSASADLDQAWVSGSGAIIGAGTSGAYTITLDSSTSSAGVLFTTSGYTITGANMTFSLAITNAANVTTTISNLVALSGQTAVLGSGSILNLNGGFTSSGNPGFSGSSVSTSTYNFTGGAGNSTTAGALSIYNATFNQTNGVISGTGSSSAMYIAYHGNATYNLSGGVITNLGLGISRGSVAILNMTGGGIGAGGTSGLRIASIDGTDSGTLNMSGGTLVCYSETAPAGYSTPIGSTSTTLEPVAFCAAAATYSASAVAVLNFSGGMIGAKGLVFGNPSGKYTANPTCQFTMTGGLLYLDSLGIGLSSGLSGFTSPVLNISGGTIAATANWIGSMPMTLYTTNGDITFQCADTNGNPFNIALSGNLTGSGGLIKTGEGILTLSGPDNFTGNTIVSNGQFDVVTTAAGTSIGPVAVASGAILSTGLGASGQSWTNAGLVVGSSAALDFNFGGVLLSSSQPVMEVNGNFTWDSSDSVTIEGSTLLEGTYPLITCSGTLTLTGGSSLPLIASLPSGVSATLEKSGKTINLVVSGSPNNFIKWGSLSSGTWDFATADWVNVGSASPVDYTDAIGVDLNDDGNSTVTINLTTDVSPGGISANNTSSGTASYTITGSGSIGGGGGITLQGSGVLALATSNTYTGGTIVNSGTLAIDLGGDGVTESAIGTGPLTINGGALDNTSGSNVVLRYPTQQYWDANFSYIGSQTNFDLGPGPVTLVSNTVQVTVLSNTLACDGIITDNGLTYGVTVQGPGALSLNGFNNYTGSTSLNSGKLNINNGGDGGADSAIGGGSLIINGGAIDNITGTNVMIQAAIPETWNANFAFGGSGNLDLGPGTITTAGLTLTLQNGATLQTEGQIIAAGGGGVATLTLQGNGAFQTSGAGNDAAPYTLDITVNSGSTLLMDKSSPGAQSAVALTVNTGGTARVTGTGGYQVGTSTKGLITLAGGTLDLFGSPNETTYAITFNSGTLENSSTNPSILSLVTSMDLTGTACYFDVASNSSLAILNYIYGPGSLVKVDGGTLNLGSTNSYAGSTTVSNGLLSFTTATTANGDYTVAGGELEALLDPNGVTLQMSMSSLTFGPATRLGFDLASGGFGDTTSSLIAGGGLTMNGNVAVDVTNAPSDNNNDVLLSYSSRSGFGAFVPGHIPAGAYIYDNTAAQQVILTYTPPPALSKPSFATGSVSASGGVVNSITFSGANGTPGGFYQILSSTNVALRPFSAWTQVQSGNYDQAGDFNATLNVDPAATQTFYVLYVP